METPVIAKITSPLQSLLNDLIAQESEEENQPVLDNTYYRSRLFTANTGPNNLVAAAQPLIALISRLINSPHLNELETIQQLLPHELKAFAARAQGFGYPTQVTSLSRYLLCCAFEDIVEHLAEKTDSDAAADKMQSSAKSENFFNLLNHLRHQSTTYIDLIELAYVILCIGYCGNYRYLANGKVELENLLESLYLVIREQRGDVQPELEIADSFPIQEKKNTSSISLGWLTTLVVSIILSFTIGFSYVLNSLSHSMMMQLK